MDSSMPVSTSAFFWQFGWIWSMVLDLANTYPITALAVTSFVFYKVILTIYNAARLVFQGLKWSYRFVEGTVKILYVVSEFGSSVFQPTDGKGSEAESTPVTQKRTRKEDVNEPPRTKPKTTSRPSSSSHRRYAPDDIDTAFEDYFFFSERDAYHFQDSTPLVAQEYVAEHMPKPAPRPKPHNWRRMAEQLVILHRVMSMGFPSLAHHQQSLGQYVKALRANTKFFAGPQGGVFSIAPGGKQVYYPIARVVGVGRSLWERAAQYREARRTKLRI